MIEAVAPIRHSVAVTPADDTDLTTPCRALLVGAAGNVKLTYVSGITDTVYLNEGVWHGMYVKRVYATDTTATGIHAGY